MVSGVSVVLADSQSIAESSTRKNEFYRSISDTISISEALIIDKEFNIENMRKAMKLPSLRNMTIDDIHALNEALTPFQKGDEFLSVRKLETVDRTELKGIKTWREAKERLAEKLGLPIEVLENIKVSEFDRFRYDTGLARKKFLFYKMMVEESAKRMLVSEAKYLEIRKKDIYHS